MQLMIGQIFSENFSGSTAGTIKFVIRISHVIQFVNCPKTTFIKRTIVCNKWQSIYQRFDFSPYIRKIFRFFRICVSQSVNSCCPLRIIVGARTDQTIDFLNDFSVPHDDNPYAAYAGALSVGCFKVDSCKVLHAFCCFLKHKCTWYFLQNTWIGIYSLYICV